MERSRLNGETRIHTVESECEFKDTKDMTQPECSNEMWNYYYHQVTQTVQGSRVDLMEGIMNSFASDHTWIALWTQMWWDTMHSSISGEHTWKKKGNESTICKAIQCNVKPSNLGKDIIRKVKVKFRIPCTAKKKTENARLKGIWRRHDKKGSEG